MAKRSDTRDVAREKYLAKKQKGEKVNLVELAEEVGAKYDTVRRWKSQDKWMNLATLIKLWQSRARKKRRMRNDVRRMVQEMRMGSKT